MGNQKLKWTSDEEQALLAGIEKHGPGRWKNIIKDPQFAPILVHRSNIDLKDKWRNMNVSSGQGSREKSKTPKATNNNGNTENSAPNSLVVHFASSDTPMDDDPPNTPQDVNNAQWYNIMIFEALSALRDLNLSDMSAICNYIEQRNEPPLPPNFRRLLGARLRRLVVQGKLEKVQNGYRIRTETRLGSPTETPTPKQKEVRPQKPQNSTLTSSPEATPQEAGADEVAYRIADAENSSFLANKAMNEVESVSKIAEECEAMLEIVKDIYVQCSQGEIIFLA